MPTIITTDYVRPGTAAKLTTLARDYVHRFPAGAVRSFVVCRQLFLHLGDLKKYQPRDTATRAEKLERIASQPQPTRRKKAKAKVKGVRIDPSLYVTVSTAAGLAGCSRSLIGLDCRNGRIPAVQIDGQWLVLRSAAANRDMVATGRPRKHAIPAVRT
jgi:hypothetical protein